MKRALFATLLAVPAVLGAPARAQTPAGAAPLDLETAVSTALAHSPEVAQAATEVAAQEAALEEALGLFSRRFGLHSLFDYGDSEISPSRRKSELNRRLRLEIPPPEFDTVARQLIDRLPVAAGETNPGSLLYPDCDQATTFFVLRNDDGTLQSVLCFNDQDELIGILGRSPNGIDLNAFNLSGLFDDLSEIDAELDAFVKAQLALVADEMRTIAIALRLTAASLRLQRQRIGRIPDDQESIRFELGGDWQHRFRSGSSFVTTAELVSTEDNYKGKRLTPGYGDSTVPNSFVATFGLSYQVPLGRGGGRVAAYAPVLSAEASLEAARALYAHTANTQALATLEACWDTAAAARRLALLEASLATQQRIFEATEELVAGDVIPRVDLARNRASIAQVTADVAAARQALGVRRLALQRAMGLDATTLAAAPTGCADFAPLAGTSTLGYSDVEALVAAALAARSDVAASGALVTASQALAAGARRDLRPEVALTFNASYNAFHETFRDRFYDFEGFHRALEGKWAGPSYGIALRVRLPIGNRSAEGRLVQAESSLSSSRISAGDLERNVRLRIQELTRTIGDTAAELAAQRAALENLEQTHAASLERYQAGDLSIVDTLLTEQQLTDARLGLVDVERRYASLLAQLRFETGTLIELARGRTATEARLTSFGGAAN